MVFVRHRRAKQRENAVAGRLHHVAVVAAHRLDHEMQRRIDHGARLLGVEVRHQLGGALDVGEQSGDCLALTLGHIGRVHWRLFDQTGCSRTRLPGSRTRRAGIRLKGCAAFTAKLRRRSILETAPGAAAREPNTAFDAELRAVAIVKPARRTAHGLDPRADYTPHRSSRGTASNRYIWHLGARMPATLTVTAYPIGGDDDARRN